MRKITVAGLIPYPPNTTPSQRFRIEQWMPYLSAQQIEIDLLPFADGELMQVLHRPGEFASKAAQMLKAFYRRTGDVLKAKRYDAVFLHRAVCLAGPAFLERVMTLFRCPVIYDFDDAIFFLDTTTANRAFGWLKFPGKTASICRLSSHVIVGNEYLADYARQFNRHVTVVPTSIDTRQYQPTEESNLKNGKVVLGWTGSSTSQTHLEWFAPVLAKLLKRREVEVRVISNRLPVLPDVPHVWREWRPETEVEELRHFDVGIMPMPDDPWARGKCSLKALQYMAMGIPTICAAVGTNREVIEHGKNGFLAATEAEWLDFLTALVDDVTLRQRLGAAGRQTIEQRYSMQQCANQLAKVIRQVTDQQVIKKAA